MSARVPRTVAIVLNYQREALTAACVESLERSDTPVEVLIVDNASPDGSGARLRARFPQHAYLDSGGNLGYAGGNALGTEWALSAGAERVFIVNDDAEVAPDCLRHLHAALDADPKAAAAAPLITYAEPADRVWWAGGHFSALRVMGTHEHAGQALSTVDVGGGPRAVGSLCGCAMLIEGEALTTLGGLRADFWAYAEDLELSVRYARAGRRLLFVPAGRVMHKVPFPEPEAAGWKIALRDRNRRRIARLHLTAAERALFWAFFLPSRLLRMLQYAVRGDGDRLRGIARGLAPDRDWGAGRDR